MSTIEDVRQMLAAIVSEEIPKLALTGAHSYRVVKVYSSGRCDLEAVKKGPPASIPSVDHWTGIAGGEAHPAVGSLVVVTFLDGEKNAPMIGAYQPLRVDGGKPDEVTIDGKVMKIGPTATSIEIAGTGPAAARVGDEVTLSGIKVTSPPGGGVCSIDPGPSLLTGTITSGSTKVTIG